MKKATVNDYFRHHWVKLMLFALFTAAVSFFAPLKNFQLKWLIDSKSKQEALGYMGLVFLITFTSWFFERLSRRSFTKLACGAVEQVRGQVMERVLRRPVSQYQREGDAAYLSLLTTDLRTLYDDYYMSLFNIAFWGGIMLCALGMYLYISPVMLAAILLVTVPPLVLPRKMNERLKASRDAFSLQMAGYTQQLKELLGGFEVIRGFLREDAYAARHRDAARQARDSEQAYQQSLNAMVVNTSLISNLIFPIVMLVGLFLAFDGRLTMGTVSTAASMANFVITPCNQIAQCWAKVRSSKGIRQRLEAAMSGPEKVSAGRAIGKLEHIECKDTGFSYPERLRFDFTHFQSVTADELKKVEDIVNEQIANAIPVETKIMSIEEAKKTGAMALFGEKYGENVRVVCMGDFSKEFCGGTHVANTANIRLFKIVSESGVAAGVRRIEALTDKGVLKYYEDLERLVKEASEAAKTESVQLVRRIHTMNDEIKALSSENEKLKAELANNALGDVSDNVVDVKGVKFVATKVDNVDMNELRNLGDKIKTEIGSGVVLVVSATGSDKVNMIAMATDDAVAKGAHSGNLIKAVASLVGGGGGGRPNMAQAGGKNPAGIDELLKKAPEVLAEQINA